MAVRLDLVGLVVRDMRASLEFYKHLGVNVPLESAGEPHVEVTLPNGLRLAWDTVELMEEINPGRPEPAGHRMGLAFLCSSPAKVDAKHDELTAAGYRSHKEPWDAFWGQRYAIVDDPDGNHVDLFAPLPHEGGGEPG